MMITSGDFHLPSGSSFGCAEEAVRGTQRHQTSAAVQRESLGAY